MNNEMIRRAVQSALREAFNMGHRAGAERRPTDLTLLRSRAITYGEELISPMAELAIEQAREEGYIAGRAARAASGEAA